MNLIPVTDSRTIKEFHDLPRRLYSEDPNWICPLETDIESTFDPSANPYFDNGEAIRWILKDDHGEVSGRIAAFINYSHNRAKEQKAGGVGFFECINDKSAAFQLFDAARDWLSERGMKAMDGPINFGENTDFWGLLVDGFVRPSYGMNYNFPYYQELFAAYGFGTSYEQITNAIDFGDFLPERFTKIARWVKDKPHVRVEHFSSSELDRYIQDFVYIYNKAWTFHQDFTPMKPEIIRSNLEKMRPFMIEDLIIFVYVKDEPAAFLVNVPDVNQIIAKLNGKLNWWAKLKFWYYSKRQVIDTVRMSVIGVIPDCQKMGLESVMIMETYDVTAAKYAHFKHFEVSWVGDFNPKMRALQEASGARFLRKHATLRKVF